MADAPAVIASAAEQHLARFLAAGHRVLGLAGAPGSGKSTLAEHLVARVPGACLLPMDGFHLADEELERLGRASRKGAPDTFDVDGFVATLRRVRDAARDVVVPRFRRDLEAAIAGSIRVRADAPLVVVEGNYLLLPVDGWEQARACLDECWLLRPDDAVRRARLVQRHIDHGRSPTAAAAWVREVDEPNAELIARHAEGATHIIDPG